MKNLTVCIPVYKRLDFLKALVESIPEDYPVCVSDNGNYVNDNLFARGNVKIRHIENVVSMFSNWNQAIDMVDTEWFVLPGDDDIIYPEKLAFIEKQIESYSDCAYLAFGYDIINENNEKIAGWRPKETRKYEKIEAFHHIQRIIPYRCPSLIINTAKSRSVGNYCEEFAYTASDSLFLQHLALTYPITEVNKVIAGYRMWDNNFTSMKNATTEWFDQLDLWIQKLSELVLDYNIMNTDICRLHDLVFFDNLVSAFGNMENFGSKLNLLSSVGWPKRIGIINHLKLLKMLIH